MVAEFTDKEIGAHVGNSTYEIRVVGTVPLELLENFRQIESLAPAGTIMRALQLDDAALWGLIDALHDVGIDLIDVRREIDPAEWS